MARTIAYFLKEGLTTFENTRRETRHAANAWSE